MSDMSDFVCLAHDHGDREQEAICSARFQIAALRAQLTTAERERDEARRERDDYKAMYLDLWDAAKRHESERDKFASMLHDCENERDGWKHRAERAERVVETAREWLAVLWRGDLNGTAIGVCMEYEPDGQYALWEQVAPIAEAVRAIDAAEGT